jgi:hypothetical protein
MQIKKGTILQWNHSDPDNQGQWMALEEPTGQKGSLFGASFLARHLATGEEAYIGPDGSEVEIVPTVQGVTLDNGQWVTFMNTVTEDWVRQYIATAYPGRVISEIRWDERP